MPKCNQCGDLCCASADAELSKLRAEVAALKDERASDACWDAHCLRHTEKERTLGLRVQEMKIILDACAQQPCSCHMRGATLCGSCRARNLLFPDKRKMECPKCGGDQYLQPCAKCGQE